MATPFYNLISPPARSKGNYIISLNYWREIFLHLWRCLIWFDWKKTRTATANLKLMVWHCAHYFLADGVGRWKVAASSAVWNWLSRLICVVQKCLEISIKKRIVGWWKPWQEATFLNRHVRPIYFDENNLLETSVVENEPEKVEGRKRIMSFFICWIFVWIVSVGQCLVRHTWHFIIFYGKGNLALPPSRYVYHKREIWREIFPLPDRLRFM